MPINDTALGVCNRSPASLLKMMKTIVRKSKKQKKAVAPARSVHLWAWCGTRGRSTLVEEVPS